MCPQYPHALFRMDQRLGGGGKGKGTMVLVELGSSARVPQFTKGRLEDMGLVFRN